MSWRGGGRLKYVPCWKNREINSIYRFRIKISARFIQTDFVQMANPSQGQNHFTLLSVFPNFQIVFFFFFCVLYVFQHRIMSGPVDIVFRSLWCEIRWFSDSSHALVRDNYHRIVGYVLIKRVNYISGGKYPAKAFLLFLVDGVLTIFHRIINDRRRTRSPVDWRLIPNRVRISV